MFFLVLPPGDHYSYFFHRNWAFTQRQNSVSYLTLLISLSITYHTRLHHHGREVGWGLSSIVAKPSLIQLIKTIQISTT